MKNLLIAVAGFGIFMTGLFIGIRNPDDPMPCKFGEVYVWVDYPATAKCVSADDHAAHEMSEHGND